jgi:hypothetical protein
MIQRVYGFLIILLFFAAASSLDVSFLPNDENAPLPLSQKYRESLRKLCSLYQEETNKIPPELLEKRAILAKMCQKLAKDDANIDSAEQNMFKKPVLSLKTFIFSLLGVGGGYVMWNNRRWLGSKVGTILKGRKPVPQSDRRGYGTGTGSSSLPSASDGVGDAATQAVDADLQAQRIIEAREARLRRFAEINANANIDLYTAPSSQ